MPMPTATTHCHPQYTRMVFFDTDNNCAKLHITYEASDHDWNYFVGCCLRKAASSSDFVIRAAGSPREGTSHTSMDVAMTKFLWNASQKTRQ